MLRARPTQIGLNSRDLDWHHVRHVNRQAQRARDEPVRVVDASFPDSHSPPQIGEALPPYGLARPRSSQLSPIRGLQVPTFSNDQDMRHYWSSIMANAGGLPPVQNVNSGRPTMINVSPSSRSTVRASRVSFESADDSIQDYSDDNDEESNYTLHSSEVEETLDETPPLDSEVRLKNQSTGDSGQINEHFDRQSVQESRKRRLSFTFHRRRAHGRGTVAQISLPDRPSEHAGLDGSFDRYPPRHANGSSTSAPISATESQYLTAQSSLSDDHSGVQHFSAGPRTFLSADHMVSRISDLLASSSPFEDKPEHSPSLSPPRPRQFDFIQRRSSGLPRSPLYISQAAVSSSPQKRPISSIDLPEEFSSLSLYPRRTKRYKRRSQSYPYILSEADPSTEHNSSSQDIYHTTLSHHSIPHDPRPALTDPRPMLTVALNPSNDSLRSPSHASSGTSFTSSPPRLNLSPLPPPSTPQQSRSPAAPPLPIPTYPFSAVRRAVSFASPNPSPANSSSPSPIRAQFTHFSTPVTPPYSFNNLPPRTPTYRVYNDRLPASVQPQTPLGLPRNGIPDGGLPGVRGANTAPVGGQRRSLGRLRDGGNRGVGETPTRSGNRRSNGGMGGVEQENARHGHETLRRWQRMAETGELGGEGDGGVEGLH